MLSVSGSSESRLHRERCRELMVTQRTTVVLGKRGFKKATTRHGWCVIIKRQRITAVLLKIEVFWNVLYVVSTDKATDVSKDRNTFIFRISKCRKKFRFFHSEDEVSNFRSVMSVNFNQSTRRNIPEHLKLHYRPRKIPLWSLL